MAEEHVGTPKGFQEVAARILYEEVDMHADMDKLITRFEALCERARELSDGH